LHKETKAKTEKATRHLRMASMRKNYKKDNKDRPLSATSVSKYPLKIIEILV